MNRIPWQEIGRLTVEHVLLVAVAMAIAVTIAVPAGVWITRDLRARPWVLGTANIIQTIPSLAVLGFLIPIAYLGGVGKRSAIVALVLYALLPILKNTLTGILSVDPAVRDSAIALGMTDRQLLLEIELPLAARSILAGIHIAIVANIGTATIAAAIGAGGLGVLIFRGISTVNSGLILAGAIPAAALSLLVDQILRWTEDRFFPISSRSEDRDSQKNQPHLYEAGSPR